MNTGAKAGLAAVLGLGIVAAAQNLPGYTRLFQESQTTSRAAPTNPTLPDGGQPPREVCAQDDEGTLIDSQYAYRISVCGPANSVLDGGSLQMWVLDTDRCQWMRNPTADETVTGGARCQQFPDRRTGVAVGRMLPACSGVGLLNADAGVSPNDGGSLCGVQVKQFMWRGTGSGN